MAANTINTLNFFEAAKPKSATAVFSLASMRFGENTFVGRSTELSEMADFLSGEQDSTIALVAGPPGVGKTALVRQAAAAGGVADSFHQALFADLHGYQDDSAVMPDEVYASILRCVGVAADDIPTDPQQRATMYHTVLDQLAGEGSPVLIWLDNVSTEDQFAPLRPASSIHKVVVTTRENFADVSGAHRLEVRVLDRETSVELLRTVVCGRNPGDQRFGPEHAHVLDLIELCDRLPLALQIVAALLADEPDRPVADLARDLAAEESRLDGLDYDRGRLSVRAALRLSYERLPDDLRRLFRLLSVVPGGDVSLAAAAALNDSAEAAVRPRLMSLVRSHLVEQHIANRWRMHDLVRLYSAEVAAAHPDETDQAYSRVKDHYRLRLIGAFEWLTAVASAQSQKIFTTPAAAAEWFELERLTLISFVMQATRDPNRYNIAVEFGVLVGDVLKQQRHLLKEFHDIAAAAASVAKKASDKKAAVGSMNNYGSALRMLEQYDRAIEIHRQAETMYEEMGNATGVSVARSNIANVLQSQGKYQEAINIYKDDIELSRRTGHRHNEASTLISLGTALRNADRRPEAVAALQQAVKLNRDLGDLSALAVSLNSLGGVLQEIGRPDRAVPAHQAALEIYRMLQSSNGAANAANNLGYAQYRLGRFSEAAANLRMAAEYFEMAGNAAQAKLARDYLEIAETQVIG